MKSILLLALLVLVLGGLAGCNQDKEAENAAPANTTSAPPASGGTPTGAVVATSAPKGSVKVGDKHVCAVCAVKEGTKEPEEVKAVLDYQGKTYAFCSEDEKAEFISNPTKYAGK